MIAGGMGVLIIASMASVSKKKKQIKMRWSMQLKRKVNELLLMKFRLVNTKLQKSIQVQAIRVILRKT